MTSNNTPPIAPPEPATVTLEQALTALVDLTRHLTAQQARLDWAIDQIQRLTATTTGVDLSAPPTITEQDTEPEPPKEIGLFTTALYAETHGLPTHVNNLRSLGHFAGQIARERGIPPYKGPYGTGPKAYPEEVFDAAVHRQYERKGGPVE